MVQEIKCFFEEHKNNRSYIWKLAVSKAKEETINTTLGIYWDVIRDLVFFVAYGLFMFVMRGSHSQIDGMPMLVYLFTGLVAWYMIRDDLNIGVNCMVKNKNIFTKIKFPIMVIPTIETIALYIKRVITVILLALVLGVLMIVTGWRANVNILGLIYSIGASLLFGIAYSLFMSGFYTISKDFRELYKAIVRIQFYFVPIFWSVDHDLAKLGLSPGWIEFIKNLPFIHLIDSFRMSIASGAFPPKHSVLIFFAFVLVLFLAGCYIQYRLRRIYADFI